jgi:MFS family permease
VNAEPPRPRVAALALAVGLVLADSSIVVLALPEIYRELDTSVAGVTWVLISFNLVMALAAVPGAHLARRVGPGRAAAVGLAVFAGASLACGVAEELSTLIAARCVQALGGAVAVTAALELLPATLGAGRRSSGPAPAPPARRLGRRSAAPSPSSSPGSRSS